jgi:cytochrome P450
MGLIAKRRGEAPVDDVLGMLLESGVDGELFTDEQIFRQLLIILFGGLDTTSAVMLESLLFLGRNPQEKSKLADGQYKWATAIEEFVRFTSPIQGLRRTVTGDTELGGVCLHKGDWVFGLHGSANRDESIFKDASTVKLDRLPNPHVGFGTGAHICLGRNLARLEIEVLLKAVLERLSDFSVGADFSPEYLVGEARGMKALPVVFTPGSVLGPTS